MGIIESFTRIAHPICVHFPIALVIVSAFLATISIFRNKDFGLTPCIRILIFIATAGAWAAVISGNWGVPLPPEGIEIRKIHHEYALWTSLLISFSSLIYIFVWSLQKRIPTWIGFFGYIALLAATVFIAITGYFGGYIVYNILIK